MPRWERQRVAFCRDDAGGFLPAVLQRVEPEVGQLGRFGVPEDADDAAHGFTPRWFGAWCYPPIVAIASIRRKSARIDRFDVAKGARGIEAGRELARRGARR